MHNRMQQRTTHQLLLQLQEPLRLLLLLLLLLALLLHRLFAREHGLVLLLGAALL
jgi:hypothetical protein